MPVTPYLGVGARIKSRLKTLGYWKHGKPDVPRYPRSTATWTCASG